MTKTLPYVGPSTMSGASPGGMHAAPVKIMDGGPPLFRPGLSRGGRQRIGKRNGGCFGLQSVPRLLSVGVVDWLRAPLPPTVCGNTFTNVFALLVRSPKIFHRKKLLACFSAPGQATKLPRRLRPCPFVRFQRDRMTRPWPLMSLVKRLTRF